MRFRELAVAGAYEIEAERFEDERGFFARVFSVDELAAQGLCATYVHGNASYNRARGTLRGLHLQVPPHGEVKLVTCTRGRIFDVAADLRPESPTFLRWAGAELTAEARNQLYVPEGCAHGFVTLEDDCEVRYLVSAPYTPAAEAGVRYDDAAFAVAWPVDATVVSERDRGLPPLDVDRLRAEGIRSLNPDAPE